MKKETGLVNYLNLINISDKIFTMSSEQIEAQIKTIRDATKEAAVSKEKALEFLVRAGIVPICHPDIKPEQALGAVKACHGG